MEYLISHLDFILPAVLVMMVAVYMLNKVLSHDHTRRVFEYKKHVSKELIPLRMQAYERLTLFLERMQPMNLLIRVQKPNMKSRTLHLELIKAIRSEFEHNMSQQVYISDDAWRLINQAKDQLISIINDAVTKVSPSSDASTFGKLLLEVATEEQNWIIDNALLFLKDELRKNY